MLVTFKKFREITGLSRSAAIRYFETQRLTPIKAAPKLTLIDLDEWNKNFGLEQPIQEFDQPKTSARRVRKS